MATEAKSFLDFMKRQTWKLELGCVGESDLFNYWELAI